MIDPWEALAMEFGPFAPYAQRMAFSRDLGQVGQMMGMPQLGNIATPDIGLVLMDALLKGYGQPEPEKFMDLSPGSTVFSTARGPVFTAPKPREKRQIVKPGEQVIDENNNLVYENTASRPQLYQLSENERLVTGAGKEVARGLPKSQGKKPEKVTMFRERADGTFVELQVPENLVPVYEGRGYQRGTRKGTPQDTTAVERQELERTSKRISILERGIENILQRYGVESGIFYDPKTGAPIIRTSSRDLAFQEVKKKADETTEDGRPTKEARQAQSDLRDLTEKYREIERLSDKMLPDTGELPYEYQYNPRTRRIEKAR